MSLTAGCPRCAVPVLDAACVEHPDAGVLWRVVEADYDAFGALLLRAAGMPVYLPWPLTAGWSVADFGVVTHAGGHAVATVTSTVGTSDVDGPVEVTLVAEEPGVGLGARVASMTAIDPGAALGRGPAPVRLRLDRHPVPLWPVPAPASADALVSTVFAGEAEGRWLWVVIRPATAALLLRDDWLVRDASQFGPAAVDLPFGGIAARW